MTLRSVVRQRLLDDMIGSIEGDFKVLIVDKCSVVVLGSCCKNSDVLDKKVVVIENIHLARQPLPTYPAIYFLSPHEESVDLFVKDWEETRPYLQAHVFFTSRLPDNLFDKLGRGKCGKYIRTLKEVNVDFLCNESQVSLHIAQGLRVSCILCCVHTAYQTFWSLNLLHSHEFALGDTLVAHCFALCSTPTKVQES